MFPSFMAACTVKLWEPPVREVACARSHRCQELVLGTVAGRPKASGYFGVMAALNLFKFGDLAGSAGPGLREGEVG